MSTDEPDFAGWCEAGAAGRRLALSGRGRLVTSEAEMRANLPDCVGAGGRSRSASAATTCRGANKLKVVQKFGTGPAQHRHRRLRRDGHQASHAAPARQHFLRRACVRADADAGAQARELDGLVTVERIKAAGLRYRPFDRRHTPGSNYAAPRRHTRAQWCDHRHHWLGRDRPRDCLTRRGLRHARALSPAHAPCPRPRSAN